MQYFFEILYLCDSAWRSHAVVWFFFHIGMKTNHFFIYNYVADDCALFREHLESAYNLINSPHLKPVVLLDSILMQFLMQVKKNLY
jgi:hypothetical protein